jgi:hypothetical protein
MNRITFPLKRGMQGPAVADLQDVLQFCLERSAILANDAGTRQELSAGLKPERERQTYDDVTSKLVSIFQRDRNLQSNGAVDEPTATALNAQLAQWGLLDQAARSFVVSGQARREDGVPLPDLQVRAVHQTNASPVRLGKDTTDAEGRYTIRYELLPGMDSINLRVTVFDADGKPLRESDVIPGAKPLESVDLIVLSIAIKPYQVGGKVASRTSAGVGGLRVVIVDKGIGGEVQLAETNTDEDGAYHATFSDTLLRQRGKAQPDLQARVFAGEAFLGASNVRYNASQHENLNALLEDKAASALRSEHEVLTGALAGQFTGKLGDLRETDDRQDISYLANKTGWDARAVALAALADQFSARAAVATGNPTITPAHFYALFRAGLPANEDTLYHADAKTLEAIWKKAVEQGIIPMGSADQIPNLIGSFQTLSAQKLLTSPALVGASSFKEMLTVSRLNAVQQEMFAQLYAVNRKDMPTFWKAVGVAFGPDMANKLQVDGKLGFLTINNAPLMQKVHATVGANGLSDPLQLAQGGYHRAESWGQLLTEDVPLPKEIPGDRPETKRANYAKYLAAQVRLSYPTASVAEMISNADPKLRLTFKEQNFSDEVHQFLTQNQGQFEIGVQPVQRYIAQNKLQVADETVQQVKRLQRVYQITPSDQALTGLMKRGIDAAYHVIRYDKDTFVQNFAADLGGADQAALTYDKSVQVHNTVLNVALSYLNARTAPAIGVHSPPNVLDPAPANAGDVIAYATLESLFGSMDFCACDHCRSILSPAAYLVDLLLFLDQPNHPVGTENPQTVLLEHRPDMQHLLLTCENTNTALPYIDVVNETLEYFVANSNQKLSLKDYQGHDTNGAASEDLLASPQFVMDSAYMTLRNEGFPATLPFHQPLESLRRYFNKFEVPLPLAMERFLHKTDDLERGANPYGWRDILMEELGLSRAEYEILTDSVAVPLWRIYGFPNGTTNADVIDGLSNAKQFARRIGISYEELDSILKTRFINPNGNLIPKLERLGVNFAMLAELKTKNDTATDAKFDNLLTKLTVPPDPAEYGGDVKAWVKNNDNYARIMSLITLAIPANTWAASTAYGDGDCVKPAAAASESTLYHECTTPGTSAASEPKWPTIPGNTYTDGTIVWTCRDASSCRSFENLAFRYSDPARTTQNIGAVEFVCMLRFIRLWKKTGWTIEQIDAAICALYRADLAPLDASDVNDVAKLDTGFLTLLPRLGIVIRVMEALNLTVKRDLLSLLACWSEIGMHGETSLYRQMFLNPVVLEQDAVFADNGYGEFLQDASQTLLAGKSQMKVGLAGKITTNDTLIISINGVEIPYQVVADDTTVTILATHIVSTINVKTTADPISGLPLNQVILASNSAGTITIKSLNPDVPFTLACSLSTGATETFAILDHESALRAAFNLTGDEYDRIAAALGYDSDTTLTIPNISAIFRRGWLARKLKLSVRELLLLIQLTGLDPFAAPDPTHPAILRLISLVQVLKDRSLKSAAALYLIWNQDLSGKSAPDPAQITELGRTLRGDFAGIEDQFAAIDDPNGDVARARMTLVYGQETSDAFFALLDDTLIVDAPYTHPAPAFEPAIPSADPGIAYDGFRHRLSHKGLVTAAMQTALKNITGVSGDFLKAIDLLFARSEDAKGSFFARNKELLPIYDNVSALDRTLVLEVDYAHSAPTLEAAITSADNRIRYDNVNHRLSYSGVFTAARRDILKSVSGVIPAFEAAVDGLFVLSQKSRGLEVLRALQPELSRRRKRQQASQRLSAAAGVELAFAQVLLDSASVPYPLHAGGDRSKPALDDVLALETPGLAVQFFFRDTATGNVDQSVADATHLEYFSRSSNPLPVNPTPGAAISGIWGGQVETPEAGFYNFVVEADIGATVKLTLDGQGHALTQNGNVWRNTDPLELKAGTLYKIELRVEKVKDALSLKWETPKRTREVIPSRYLYPPTIIEPFSGAYIRFLRTASLALGLGLTANEMAHFATHSDYQIAGEGWLNLLPVSGDPTTLTAIALLKPFQALLDYANIKADTSPNDESLLIALEDPTTATQKTDSLLFTITRWNRASLNDVLAQFNDNIAGLGHFQLFSRVYDAFTLIQKMGISAQALAQATTNEPTGDTVRNLQAALRARYDTTDWRDVIQPINNELRSLQRDALVAYILHQMRSHPESAHIDTPDKLFEYFLMDVQMDPCMQTSRIRHALSSAQLFTERCLMNLEPRVSSAAINVKQWEWMKRYRVWEANRKLYFFTENWLETELRDDKSPFFKEIESELLQSDISEDSATTALLNYLSKLEEVAKLEPCGICYIPADQAKRLDEIDHVVARTAGASRKYYYRRYEYGYWTAWEQIKLDIEDNPVIPVVWMDRLLLFWLRILKSPIDPKDQAATPAPSSNGQEKQFASMTLTDVKTAAKTDAQTNTQMNVQAVLCWSEYYNGKWQATKTSAVNNPISLGSFLPFAFSRSTLRLRSDEPQDGQLRITVYGNVKRQAFLLYNTHSLPQQGGPSAPILPFGGIRGFDTAGPTFTINYNDKTPDLPDNPLSRDVLTDQLDMATVQPNHYVYDIHDAPFFFEDARNVFYVTTEQKPVYIRDQRDFGVIIDPGVKQAPQIPPLVVQPGPTTRPKFWGDGGPIGPDQSFIDPAPMQRFVTEDAYIRQGIGATAVVIYGDRRIGPSGTVSNLNV